MLLGSCIATLTVAIDLAFTIHLTVFCLQRIGASSAIQIICQNLSHNCPERSYFATALKAVCRRGWSKRAHSSRNSVARKPPFGAGDAIDSGLFHAADRSIWTD